jgi:hypothetical protein
MRPFVGQSVLVKGPYSNGSSVHPAVITRVHSHNDLEEGPVCVNLTVFLDCASPVSHPSVYLYRNTGAAQAALALVPRHYAAPHVAYLPEE